MNNTDAHIKIREHILTVQNQLMQLSVTVGKLAKALDMLTEATAKIKSDVNQLKNGK